MQDPMRQDELATLFARNLRLDQQIPSAAVDTQIPYLASPSSSSDAPPIAYISQHYTHSAHIVPKPHIELSTSHVDTLDLEAIFLRNSIDPLHLLPAQVKLFKNADDGQRLRLLELWRISPPSNGTHQSEELGETDLQREEALARMRYNSNQESFGQLKDTNRKDQHRWQEVEQSNAYSHVTPEKHSAMSAQSHVLDSPLSLDDSSKHAEPYILSGYEILSKRDYDESIYSPGDHPRYKQALDPVYNRSTEPELWSKPGMQDMENQYGAFAQMREYEVERQPQVHDLVAMHGPDVEMVM